MEGVTEKGWRERAEVIEDKQRNGREEGGKCVLIPCLFKVNGSSKVFQYS